VSNHVTLREAWQLWFSGDLPSTATLWGASILWWGRIGKIIELVAGLTILVDLVGSQRLRDFGSSLHGLMSIRRAAKLA